MLCHVKITNTIFLLWQVHKVLGVHKLFLSILNIDTVLLRSF